MLFGVIIIHLLQLAFGVSSSEDLGEVVFVNILFRHGDRTPISPYPNDPYKNNSLWPVGWGELTDTGKRRHYELGKWLRQRYSNLLPVKYRKEDIYVQSTDVDRTLMSAYSNLAGLYEPDLKTNWSPDIKWQPIPVHTSPLASDMVNVGGMVMFMINVPGFVEDAVWEYQEILAANKSCPRYEAYMEQLLNSETFRKIDEENKDLYDYVTKQTGMNVRGIKDINEIYNTLFIETLFNFTLPKWTAKVYPQPMERLAALSFTVPCYNRNLARLKAGPLIGQMAMHMKKKIDGKLKPDRKVWMYSAHDTTVANTLQALGLFEAQCPPYKSLVLMELRKKGNDYFVAIHFKNSSTVPPYFLQLPGCDKLCPFTKFSHLISPIVPIDWEKECQLGVLPASIYESISGGVFIVSILLTTTFLLFLILGVRLYKKRYNTNNEFLYQSLKPEIHS